MEYTIEIKNYKGELIDKKLLVKSSDNEKNNLNDFILKALSISENKRKLPFLTQCPNGLEVFPSIKMKFENYSNPLRENKLQAIMVTWRD